ncbi:MAG: hypothetical protein AAB356_00845, partial [Deltaproteobacteria bacterium]
MNAAAQEGRIAELEAKFELVNELSEANRRDLQNKIAAKRSRLAELEAQGEDVINAVRMEKNRLKNEIKKLKAELWKIPLPETVYSQSIGEDIGQLRAEILGERSRLTEAERSLQEQLSRLISEINTESPLLESLRKKEKALSNFVRRHAGELDAIEAAQRELPLERARLQGVLEGLRAGRDERQAQANGSTAWTLRKRMSGEDARAHDQAHSRRQAVVAEMERLRAEEQVTGEPRTKELMALRRELTRLNRDVQTLLAKSAAEETAASSAQRRAEALARGKADLQKRQEARRLSEKLGREVDPNSVEDFDRARREEDAMTEPPIRVTDLRGRGESPRSTASEVKTTEPTEVVLDLMLRGHSPLTDRQVTSTSPSASPLSMGLKEAAVARER